MLLARRSLKLSVMTLTAMTFMTEMETNQATTWDHRAMLRALDLAKSSRSEDGRHHPRVGAVLLMNGRILAEAFRGEVDPGEHAEFTLFERHLRGRELSGSVLITTLEPCTVRRSHKPCADWIIEKGIARVVIGMLDPNPAIYGQGITKLREQDIHIDFFPEALRAALRVENATFINQFHANPDLVGEARFNFTHNDGLFTIGHGPLAFQTRWSNAGASSIYCYTDRTNLKGLGLAIGAGSFSDIPDASVYDMSSRVRTPREGEFVVFRNVIDNFAAVQVVDVTARSHGDPFDSLSIRYRINDDGGSRFV
jgi:pyrimidine deaminase RibD-like protein